MTMIRLLQPVRWWGAAWWGAGARPPPRPRCAPPPPARAAAHRTPTAPNAIHLSRTSTISTRSRNRYAVYSTTKHLMIIYSFIFNDQRTRGARGYIMTAPYNPSPAFAGVGPWISDTYQVVYCISGHYRASKKILSSWSQLPFVAL